MTEPTAPQIPNDAPQDVKDFFDCRGNTLNWQSGDVTWLGLKVTPNVTFAPGANRGDVNITVGILGGLVSFTLPASVNAAGELVVDTSSVPDLSEWGIGGRQDIDAAIKRINDWFRHNGKKLKPARLAGGTVVLEKVPIATAPAVIPTTGPVTPPAPKPKPVAPPPPAAAPATGGGCSMLFVLMLLLLVGVISVGGYVGFVYFGGPGPAGQASATPSATATPAPSPTVSAAPSPTNAASTTPGTSPAVTPVATASATPGSAVAAACVRVVHRAVGDFISYLDWFVVAYGENIDYLEVVVKGANNDEPVTLEYDSPSGAYYGLVGLHGAGVKEIVSATLVLVDGTEIDVTDDLAHALGGKTLRVRFPQEDTFGDCSAF